ncbi:hypothetical protein GCM10010289_84730 [Streptomyces violascens]|uniref:Transposase n=1 Tax=Streptomyces violascens TaxID=67381 RepID=A0ABQ3QS65_9ACTN|nr:hypothetical protein GCM10010289_84730 [Streptomyces violascens]GHI40084.1 hypothetical protein Sviol_44920 [Streptomyces violascens]
MRASGSLTCEVKSQIPPVNCLQALTSSCMVGGGVRRNEVERLIGKLKINRAVATRFGKRA